MKLIVNKDSELLQYLYENLDMPKKKIKSLLIHKNIYINNSCITQYNYKVSQGMEIIILNKQQRNLLFEILYEDDNIIVVNKPSGLLTIATSKEKENTLYHYVSEYLKTKNKYQKVFIVHRLDKDTSGVILFAKNQKIQKQLQDNWNNLVKLREYKAVVLGRLKEKQARLVNCLFETKTNLTCISKKNNSKEAITNYQVIKENSKYSLLNIQIETGRKNQIRVQLAHINHPILGDNKYGLKDNKFSRLYLHATRLEIFYPVLKKVMVFSTKIPEEFNDII